METLPLLKRKLLPESTIENLLQTITVQMRESDSGINPSHVSNFLLLLLDMGYDCFSLLGTVIEIPVLTRVDLERILSYFPATTPLPSPNKEKIARLIVRWTSSRGGTASKERVVEDIIRRIQSKNYSVAFYDSNQNVSNRRSTNNRYVLIVLDDTGYLFNINEKRGTSITSPAS